MKRSCIFFLLFYANFIFSQEIVISDQTESFKKCRTVECKLNASIKTAEFFIEADYMDKAQQWLDRAKQLNRAKPIDSISYFVNSLQSEIFYYMELYQFGLHEAQKGIENAKIRNDSACLSDAYFFKGIHQIEMKRLDEAQQSLLRSEEFYPKKRKKRVRTLINESYIYNNLAQVKLSFSQHDSAIFYNKKAYVLANKNQVFRGIVNCEQTFGLIYAQQKQLDSARFYLSKSIASAEKFNMQDVATLNCAHLMACYLENPQKIDELYKKGLQIIEHHEVNNSYERYFYTLALNVFRKLENETEMLSLQQKIIQLNDDKNSRANIYIQNITEQYMTTENKLLLSKINELNQDRSINLLQLVAALLGLLILLFAVFFFRRKNKLQQLLLEQKNEISKDLHDDIGSELSSILINANLLSNYNPNEKQQFLISKISHTSSEISQRLNTFIWSLNTENNSIGSFCEYIKQYAGNLLEGSAIAFHYSEQIDAIAHTTCNGYVRKNLFFCIKEALNNAVKHANASQILLSVAAVDKKELQITIADNGIGLTSENAFGNGFKNIKKRMETLNGSVTLHHQNGLEIVLRISF